ncbi:MAG: LysM peptidoglycan-binding domain-containing protein [Bacteroidia bacterium]
MRIQETFIPLQQWRLYSLFAVIFIGLQFCASAQTSYKLVNAKGGEQHFSKMHVVSSGETLYGLSRQYKVSVGEIKTWNGLRSNTIDIGQRLIIETPSQTTVSTPSNQESEVAKTGIDRGEAIAFESHLSDLFSGSAQPQNQGWEAEAPDESEWSPFGEDMNSRGSDDGQTSFARRTTRDGGETAQTSNTETTASVRTKQVYYQVKSGDDIYSIADIYKVRVDQLRAWNALVEVVPGDVIVVAKREIVVPQTETTNSTSKQRGIPSRTMSPTLDTRPNSSETPNPTYRGASQNNSSVMRSDQTYYGKWMERGSFVPYEGEKHKSSRFYALHKSLPIGSTFKVMIPDNGGYFEVKVVGRLEASKNAIAALSYDTIRLLEGGMTQSEVTIYYDK